MAPPRLARAARPAPAAALCLALLLVALQPKGADAGLPLVEMTDDYVAVREGAGEALLGVRLDGPARAQPVTATLQLLASGFPGAAELQAQQPQLQVSWAEGEAGTKQVAVRSLGALGATRGGVVVVQLAAASGAEVSPGRDQTTLSSAAGAALPEFYFEPNRAAYPGDAPSVVVRLAGGAPLAAPAALRYSLLLPSAAADPAAAATAAAALPAAARSGFLHFYPGDDARAVRLPLAWHAVPPEAELHLGLRLEGFWNARARPQPGEVALHVFGVGQGTCPPGTEVAAAAGAGAPAPALGWQQQGWLNPAAEDRPAAAADDLLLLEAGAVVELSAAAEADGGGGARRTYGAMVAPDSARVTLCVRAPPAGASATLTRGGEPVGAPPARRRCREGAAAEHLAWDLVLQTGQNAFNVTLAPPPGGGAPASYGVAVVRLAPREHAELLTLAVKTLDGGEVLVCGPSEGGADRVATLSSAAAADPVFARGAGGAPDAEAAGLALPGGGGVLPCTPGLAMAVNVSARGGVASVVPTLRFPRVAGTRVEVNGAVLSRGGDVAADRAEDTAGAGGPPRGNAEFLPAAFVMGLAPGAEVAVEVVVVAEDGATSARYPLHVRGSAAGAEGGAAGAAGDAAIAYRPTEFNETDRAQKGWPLAPSANARCSACPAGWASSSTDADRCIMCPPGTAAERARAPGCAPCEPGTYAFTWGSTHCKHCIAGTFSDAPESPLCRVCPEGSTTLGDGSAACNQTLAPATDLQARYAVVVNFRVYLRGLEPENAVLLAGVAAAPEDIVATLLRADTAAAFNISSGDVRVAGLDRVGRRVLAASVSATLGVDLPADASEEEVATALEVARLSADEHVELLSRDPDAFFGRTTRALEVQVQPFDAATFSSRPGDGGPPFSTWAMVVPGALGVLAGVALVASGAWRSRGCAPARQRAAAWWHTLPVSPAAQRYARQV